MMNTTLACIYHWYTSAMFVVPVLAVGGWCWWSSRRVAKLSEREDESSKAAAVPDGVISDRPAY